MSVTGYRISGHARTEMNRRGIPEEVVRAVLAKPEQVIQTPSGRKILQTRMQFPGAPGAKLYLVRVVVDPQEKTHS